MKAIARILLALSAPLAIFAQAPNQAPPKVEFEVASVRSAEPQNVQVNVGVHIDGAQVKVNYLSLRDLLRIAYKVKDHQISAPEWMAGQRFDIAGKLPEGATGEQIPDMIKSLLEDRFQMKLHRDSRDFPVYALIVVKGGAKLKESALEALPEGTDASKANVNVQAAGGPQGVSMSFGRGAFIRFGDNKLEGAKITMAQFADMMARFMDKPVVDMTELTSTYDFSLQFTPEDYRAMLIRSAIAAGVSLPPQALMALNYEGAGDSIHASMQALGLKMESRKAPLEVLVVDSVRKTPTDN
jgi:uncharacterized protein (TIGR03435 family)